MSGESVEQAASNNEFSLKGPKGPKLPLTPYLFYGVTNRNRLCKENPNALSDEIGRLVASEWCGLTDDEKRPYIKQYEEDRARFEREKAKHIIEMAEYEAEKAKHGYISV
ncbi:HMG-box [Linderina pennispora]|uniref:HMG-box n=1 Tax=Linderina pennispora TaxID=61395 RepID=A0A1Y1W6H1_9FUNG|nr:HMG-box [Linderina pennispora]ORX69012.1 HMG-box [Linderina pennispora]